MLIHRELDRLDLRWANGCAARVALEGTSLQGISRVACREVPLRNPARLWRPILGTPEGIFYRQFILRDAREGPGDAFTFAADAVGIQTRVREEQDEYLGDIVTLPSSDAPVTDRLEWEFKPSALTLDGREFIGFAYRYRFTATDPARKIYRMFDDATWEIGGSVEGNTLLFQGQLNPPEVKLRREDFFTTACNYYGAEMKGILGKPARVSFQRLPRIGTLQSFDFLHHDLGVLFNYFDPTVEVFSVVEKDNGEDVLHILDEYRRPMGSEFTSPWKHVLFHRLDRPLAREEAHNLWKSALDFVHGRERARAGIRPSPVLPRVWTPQLGRDPITLGAHTFPRSRQLYHLADHVLPRWAEMGVKEICTPSLWVSDYTVDRLKRKDDEGMQGGLIVSGICCVREHSIDPLWGGPEAVAYLVRAAHKLGIQVQLWWATHLSRRAPIFSEHPDFMTIARDGLPNGGGFGHVILVTMDLNNPDCFEWEFNKLKAVYEATGIDGLFHDSYGNMTFLPTNYGDPLRCGQQEAYERLIARLQGIGLRSFSVEGLGPYGVGHFGMDLLPAEPPPSGAQYQNALDWFLGQEDMLVGLNMGIGQRIWPGREEEATRFAFRAVAGGGRFGFTQREGPVEIWSGWLRDLNRIHARVAPVTGRRTLLPQDRGVLWQRDGDEQILFAFRGFAHPVPSGARAQELTAAGDAAALLAGGSLAAKPWTVYRIETGPRP